jgi:hypothetical protein
MAVSALSKKDAAGATFFKASRFRFRRPRFWYGFTGLMQKL